MSTLDRLSNAGTTLADVAKAVALADVVEKVVKARREELRDGLLTDLARQAAELTGSDGFTGRIDGVGQVIMTAPQPSVKVTDRQAFGAWLAEQDVDGLVESRQQVEVVHQAEAAACIASLTAQYLAADPQGETVEVHADTLWTLLRDGVVLVTDWYPAEDAADTIIGKGWATVHGDHVRTLDPESGELGEPVPGLTVTRARQSTYVKVDPKARKQVTAEVRQALELDGGA